MSARANYASAPSSLSILYATGIWFAKCAIHRRHIIKCSIWRKTFTGHKNETRFIPSHTAKFQEHLIYPEAGSAEGYLKIHIEN